MADGRPVPSTALQLLVQGARDLDRAMRGNAEVGDLTRAIDDIRRALRRFDLEGLAHASH